VIAERAADLGRLVGQSEEYQALKRANDRLMQEQGLREQLEELRRLQIQVAEGLDRGQEPTPEQQQHIDRLVSQVQSHATYQGVVAAQANFDKLMMKVNDWILDGMKKGAESRIITLA
jgi:cell fate (sporulation/competence/biofilm development) regulator YlbF (YheA/YmcA/DUF963 family)